MIQVEKKLTQKLGMWEQKKNPDKIIRLKKHYKVYKIYFCSWTCPCPINCTEVRLISFVLFLDTALPWKVNVSYHRGKIPLEVRTEDAAIYGMCSS